MTTKEFLDCIEKEHPRIKELILKRQEEQENKKDWNLFYNVYIPDKNEGGFNFIDTPEGNDFWHAILAVHKIRPFYENYPNPKEIEMWY